MLYDGNKMSITQITNIKQDMWWTTWGRHRDEKASEHSINRTHKEVKEIHIFNKRVMKQMKKAQETRVSDNMRVCGKIHKIWLKCLEKEQ